MPNSPSLIGSTPPASPDAKADLVCPKCGGHNGLLEPLRHGWTYCNVCSARILFDDAGKVLRLLQR